MIICNLVLAEEAARRGGWLADGALWHRARSVLGLQQPRAAVGRGVTRAAPPFQRHPHAAARPADGSSGIRSSSAGGPGRPAADDAVLLLLPRRLP